MLVLRRKLGESINIDRNITISIVRIDGNRVQLGIDAPPDVPVHREEVQTRMVEQAAALLPSER